MNLGRHHMQDSEKRLKQLRIEKNNEDKPGESFGDYNRTTTGTAEKDWKDNLKKPWNIVFSTSLLSFFWLEYISGNAKKGLILQISVTPNSDTWCEALSKFTNTRLKPNNNLSITYKTFLSSHGELLLFFSIFFIVSQNRWHIEISSYCYNSGCS